MSTSNNNHHPRRSWKPDGDAHLIFQWVKMEGKPQGEVAQMLGISQSTAEADWTYAKAWLKREMEKT